MSKNKYTFLEIEQKRMVYDKKTHRNYTKTIDSSFHKEILFCIYEFHTFPLTYI